MEAAAAGAQRKTYNRNPADLRSRFGNRHIGDATGMGEARNVIIVASSDAIIALREAAPSLNQSAKK